MMISKYIPQVFDEATSFGEVKELQQKEHSTLDVHAGHFEDTSKVFQRLVYSELVEQGNVL